MSEVKSDDMTTINGADDILHLYQGAGDDARAGLEIELSFFDPSKPDLPVMSIPQNKVLKNSAIAEMPDSDWVHNEPTSDLLEASTIAAPYGQIKPVMRDANKKIKILDEKALSIGLKRSYFQELPDKSADKLLSSIMDIERYKIMYAPYREDMKKCVEYFAVCKSNQVSVSAYNADHMHENIRRLYLLAPFLFLLTDNSCGFSQARVFNGHVGMSLRHDGLKGRHDGVKEYALSSKNGEEFINRHIDFVMNKPLFMYYNTDGVLTRVPSGDWSVTFNSLRKRGLNTASNYYLAQSIMWPDIKIATLKNSEGTVTGHRYEARMFGVGIHQHQSAMLITSMLAFDKDFAARVDLLLASYGFDCHGDAVNYAGLLDKSYKAARNHNGKFFDISYGTGIMSEFAKDFADLIEAAGDNIGVHDELAPVLNICRTGCTDAKVNRTLFSSLGDIMKHQKNYDPKIFTDPNKCAHMVFNDEIKYKYPNGCQAHSAA